MQFRTMADINAYRERQAIHRHLAWQAYQLCNTLCHKLYDWYPELDKAIRLERILTKARARLARRNREEQ